MVGEIEIGTENGRNREIQIKFSILFGLFGVALCQRATANFSRDNSYSMHLQIGYARATQSASYYFVNTASVHWYHRYFPYSHWVANKRVQIRKVRMFLDHRNRNPYYVICVGFCKPVFSLELECSWNFHHQFLPKQNFHELWLHIAEYCVHMLYIVLEQKFVALFIF